MRRVERRDGYYIVKLAEMSDRVPFTCPLCTQVLQSFDDVKAFKEYACCSWCERMWIAGRHEKWLSGWRPDQTVISETLRGLGIVVR